METCEAPTAAATVTKAGTSTTTFRSSAVTTTRAATASHQFATTTITASEGTTSAPRRNTNRGGITVNFPVELLVDTPKMFV